MPVPIELGQQVSAQILDNIALKLTSRMQICHELKWSLLRLSRRLGSAKKPGTHKWLYHEIVKLKHKGIVSVELPED